MDLSLDKIDPIQTLLLDILVQKKISFSTLFVLYFGEYLRALSLFYCTIPSLET